MLVVVAVKVDIYKKKETEKGGEKKRKEEETCNYLFFLYNLNTEKDRKSNTTKDK